MRNLTRLVLFTLRTAALRSQSLWKQDTRTSPFSFMPTSTSPKPRLRLVLCIWHWLTGRNPLDRQAPFLGVDRRHRFYDDSRSGSFNLECKSLITFTQPRRPGVLTAQHRLDPFCPQETGTLTPSHEGLVLGSIIQMVYPEPTNIYRHVPGIFPNTDRVSSNLWSHS